MTNKQKIFVSICSYRDPLLKYTVESLLEEQSGEYNIIIGILEQVVKEDSLEASHPELVKSQNIKYKRIDPEFSDGVGWARCINSWQMTDEEYYYQIDSHMLFDKDWDKFLVEDYKRGVEITGSDRIIIDANCKLFGVNAESGVPIKYPLTVTCAVKYYAFQDNYLLGPHGDWQDPTDDINPAIHLCAGNLFTHAEWIQNVGINPYTAFDGEEQVLVLKSFAAGYYMFHPREIHCYHYIDTARYITKRWIKPVVPCERYSESINRSIEEVAKLIKILPTEILEQYRKYSGVDYINRKLEKRAIATSVYLPDNVVDTWTIEDRSD